MAVSVQPAAEGPARRGEKLIDTLKLLGIKPLPAVIAQAQGVRSGDGGPLGLRWTGGPWRPAASQEVGQRRGVAGWGRPVAAVEQRDRDGGQRDEVPLELLDRTFGEVLGAEDDELGDLVSRVAPVWWTRVYLTYWTVTGASDGTTGVRVARGCANPPGELCRNSSSSTCG